MKFVAKNSNLRIILEPGIPASHITGTPAKPTIFVKFNNGVAEVKDKVLIDKMVAHPGYNTDYIAVDDEGNDPFAYRREEMEPIHHISEIKYGHAEKAVTSPRKAKLTPELQKMINDLAMEKVKELLPSAIESVLKGYAAEKQDVGTTSAAPIEVTEEDEVEDLESSEEEEALEIEEVVETPKKKSALDALKGKK